MPLQIPLPKERNLYLAQQVDQASINALSKSIIEINDDDSYILQLAELSGFTYRPKPIIIRIDTYGGWVYQCLGLLGIMEKSQVPIHTIVTGCAMSCGFLISISGHKRFGYKNSTFMYHQLSSDASGKLKDMEESVMEAKRLQGIIESHVLSKTSIKEEELKKYFDNKEDWFFDIKKALKYKVVDSIID